MTKATTLKLDEALRARIEPLAKRDEKSPHAWMVDALETQVGLAELRRSFLDDALAAAADIDAGGPVYSMEEVHAHLLARAAGAELKVKAPGKRAARRR